MYLSTPVYKAQCSGYKYTYYTGVIMYQYIDVY